MLGNSSDTAAKDGVVLRMTGISKSFAGARALDQANFSLSRGQIMGLVGANGAGKSTLIKILSGAYSMDEGEVVFDGRVTHLRNVAGSQHLGIVTVYQEFSLVPQLSVAANIYLGVEGETCGTRHFFSSRKLVAKARELLASIGIKLNPEALVEDLSRAQQQMVEIAKGFRSGKRIYILDEPTASLADHEVERLFELMKTVKAKGLSVIFVSHRLNEVLSFCDQVTVLKDGKTVGVFDTRQLTIHDLAAKMSSERAIGKAKKRSVIQKANGHRGAPYISFSNFSRQNYFSGLSLDLYKNEVLGVAGLQGVGRSEFFRAALGIDEKITGEVNVAGQRANIRTPLDALRYGIVYVTEDRRKEGVFPNQELSPNISISNLSAVSSRMGIIDLQAESRRVGGLVSDLNIRAVNLQQLAMSLSGGNQQKVVLARWLMAEAKVIIFDEPTVGIDVSAKEEIHGLIDELCRADKAIVAICTEIPELLRVSDRIIVLRKNGTFSDIVDRDDVDEKTVREMLVAGLS
jgi:ABC-type sugar transport system ATPase subunit